MDDPIFISSSKESSIMAYGSRPDLGSKVVLAAIAVLIALVAILVVFIIDLRHSFFIPSSTAILVSVRPATAQTLLPQEQIARLPLLWQMALRTKSAWPVILGATRTETGWHSYVLVPRWVSQNIPGAKTNTLFLTLIRQDNAEIGTRGLRYTDAWSWRNGHRFAPVAFSIDPNVIFGNAATEQSGLEPFSAVLQNNVVYTNIPFSANAKSDPLPNADIALDLRGFSSASSLSKMLLGEVALGDLTLTQLAETPDQIGISLDASAAPWMTIVRYPNAIGRDQANLIFNGLRVTNRRITRMPSGENVTEITPWLKEGDPLPTTTETAYGTLAIDNNTIQLLRTSSTPASETEIVSENACQGRPVFARFSSLVVSRLLSKTLGINAQDIPALAFASEKNHLVICPE